MYNVDLTPRLAAALLLLLSLGCATSPRPAPPRDRFPLDPREELAGPFPPGIAEGWDALLAGDAERALLEFERAQSRKQPSLAAQIGLIEALVAGGDLPEALAACRKALPAGEATPPLLTACGEAHARSGQALAACELYRQALARAPGRPGLQARAEELRNQARDELRRQAQEAAGHKDWKAARQAALRSIELDPESAPARETAGDVEREAGDRAKALARYREALELEPSSRTLQEKVVRLALDLSDYSVAIPVLEKLAAEDPRFEAQAGEARLAFRVGNWPAPERAAARAARLTRGEAARLLWWMVPEVREARVTAGVIASDVVGRPDSREITRAVSLGLLEVDRETHRARPDAVLSFPAAAKLYLRLLELLRPGEEGWPCPARRPGEALTGPEAIRLARECRIVGEKDGPPVGGAAFTLAVDRVRSLSARAENAASETERKQK